MGASLASISQVIPLCWLNFAPWLLSFLSPMCVIWGLTHTWILWEQLGSWRLLHPSWLHLPWEPGLTSPTCSKPLIISGQHGVSTRWTLKPEWTSAVYLLSTYHLLGSWRGNFCWSPLGSLGGEHDILSLALLKLLQELPSKFTLNDICSSFLKYILGTYSMASTVWACGSMKAALKHVPRLTRALNVKC